MQKSVKSYCFLLISAAPKTSLQDLPKPQITQKEELTTVQSTDLSAREFVVYQHGLSILHLLIPQLHVSLVLVTLWSSHPWSQEGQGHQEGGFEVWIFLRMKHSEQGTF